MPSSKTSNTLDRIWELLELLPSGAPGATPNELWRKGKEEYGWSVSKRTVDRYLRDLMDADLTRTVEDPSSRKRDNEPQHWIAHSRRNLHTARLKTPDALALHLIERVADSLLPPEIVDVLRTQMESARTHLKRLRKVERTAGWAEKVAVLPDGFALRPPSVNKEILKTLQRALLAERQMQSVYRATGRSEVKRYVLEPRALVQRGAVLYVIATRPDKRDHAPAWYCVHRFEAVKMRDEPISASGFRLEEFLAAGGGDFGAPGAPIQFKAWVSPRLERTLRETPLSEDMTLRPMKDGAVLTATVRQSWPFESWILSRGKHLRVVAPDALRDETAARLRAAAAAYD